MYTHAQTRTRKAIYSNSEKQRNCGHTFVYRLFANDRGAAAKHKRPELETSCNRFTKKPKSQWKMQSRSFDLERLGSARLVQMHFCPSTNPAVERPKNDSCKTPTIHAPFLLLEELAGIRIGNIESNGGRPVRNGTLDPI